jgi:hypothetical protein
MSGERNIGEWTGLNGLNVNFNPTAPYGLCVDLDLVTGSPNYTNTYVRLPAAANSECVGVVYDKSHLNPDGTVTPNEGLAVRSWGIAGCLASAAIAAGDYVAVASALGDVKTQARAAGGVQPAAIVGRALTAAGAAGDIVMVLLMIGARY